MSPPNEKEEKEGRGAFVSTSPEDAVGLQGEDKKRYVTEMFDNLATRYDALNHVISFGHTSLWRKRALDGLALEEGERVLDVGCGTGVSTRFIKTRYPGIHVEGFDISPKMLAEAMKKDRGGAYAIGDACALPAPSEAYDLVISLYTTRNFHSLENAIREMVRVTRVKGRILLLDSFPLKGRMLPKIHKLWLKNAAPLLTAPFADKNAYRYLAESIERHKTPKIIAALFEEFGCNKVDITPYSFGAAVRILAEKS